MVQQYKPSILGGTLGPSAAIAGRNKHPHSTSHSSCLKAFLLPISSRRYRVGQATCCIF